MRNIKVKKEQNLRRFKLGLMDHDSKTGKSVITATLEVMGHSAKQALARMKRETEGATLCVLH